MKKLLTSALALTAVLIPTGRVEAATLDAEITGYATIEKKGNSEVRLAMLPGSGQLGGHSLPVRVPLTATIFEEDLRTGLQPRKIEYRNLRNGETLSVRISVQPRNPQAAANCPLKTTGSKLVCANGQSVGSHYRINLVSATRQNGARCLTLKSVKMTGVSRSPRRSATACLRPINASEMLLSGYLSDTDGLVPGSVGMDFDLNLPSGVLERSVGLGPNNPNTVTATVPAYPANTTAWVVLYWDASGDQAGTQASSEYAFRLR
jgi:hypothetical protein